MPSSDPHASVYDELLTADDLDDLADALDRDRDELHVATVVWTDGVELPLLFEADGSTSRVDATLTTTDHWTSTVGVDVLAQDDPQEDSDVE
jgi:hypothetical protein